MKQPGSGLRFAIRWWSNVSRLTSRGAGERSLAHGASRGYRITFRQVAAERRNTNYNERNVSPTKGLD